jgi:hypothetical protein
MSRLPRFLDSRFTDGSEVVSQPPIPPRKIPGTHSCWMLSLPQSNRVLGSIRSIEKSEEFIVRN